MNNVLKNTLSFFMILVMALASFQNCNQALASDSPSIIRDAEIEHMLKSWVDRLSIAAGLDPDSVHIILIQSDEVNAFVAGGANIFIYTGLIAKTDNPGELIGVIAHEMGHIRGGHLSLKKSEVEKISFESMLGVLLGIGVAVATGEPGAGVAIGQGSLSMGQRSVLAGSRVFESSADQAALTFLKRAGLGAQGFVSFLGKLEDEELLPENLQTEYVRTHPLTRNRIKDVKERAKDVTGTDGNPYPPSWDKGYSRMKAKLTGFINPQSVSWQYSDNDNSTDAIYARAIAAYRMSKVDEALKLADVLVKREPNNPYFYELKGQMLKEFGKVVESIPSYSKASELSDNEPLIDVDYAHAILESFRTTKDKNSVNKAIKLLKQAENKESNNTRIQRLLATAYGFIGEEAIAKLHVAEGAMLSRDYMTAKAQAEQAMKKLDKGSTEWNQAQDIVFYSEQNQKPK